MAELETDVAYSGDHRIGLESQECIACNKDGMLPVSATIFRSRYLYDVTQAREQVLYKQSRIRQIATAIELKGR